MQEVALVFPHQLFSGHPACAPGRATWLIEEPLFFTQYAFHKQKLAYQRASMKAWAAQRSGMGERVSYVEAMEPNADVRQLIPWLAGQGARRLHIADPHDDWLERRIRKACDRSGLTVRWHPSPMFLTPPEELDAWFEGRSRFFQTDFYIRQRKRTGMLIKDDGRPAGGQWSFDAENRKRYPRGSRPPLPDVPPPTGYHLEAMEYVRGRFPGNPGESEGPFVYPVTADAALAWLADFLDHRFHDFGPYEDAIVAGEHLLHHSLLTPMLNAGLLTPGQVMDHVVRHAREHSIPLPSVEGFVRQVIGWREFIHGIYRIAGRQQRTRNFWGFSRKIPPSFYNATTGIDPVDITIRKVLRSGYAHHIERLMVLGNFMLLCEFDPDEVYRWFMEMFVDAWDWVMVPNVYGMSQYADGGRMTTKPYLSGSNYLMKMGDYPKGPWQAVWDGLFWRFLHRHRDFFLSNPRLGMLVRTYDKMAPVKQSAHLAHAEGFLANL